VRGLPVVERLVAIGHVVHHGAQQPAQRAATITITRWTLWSAAVCSGTHDTKSLTDRESVTGEPEVPNAEEGEQDGLEAKHDVAVVRHWGVAFALCHFIGTYTHAHKNEERRAQPFGVTGPKIEL
jgi:hypothetical protein